MSRLRPFVSLPSQQRHGSLVVVDLGYSATKATCGLAHKGRPSNLRFGDAIVEVVRLLQQIPDPVLVLEAPLSTLHDCDECPVVRGQFEIGRGWYWGPGAVAALAAQRFLHVVGARLNRGPPIWLAEAFLANKGRRTRHSDDAQRIRGSFWGAPPVTIQKGAQPLLPEIAGVPDVRVF